MIEFTILAPPVAKGRPKFRMFFAKGLATQIVALVRAGKASEILSVLRKQINVSTYTETEADEETFGWAAKKYAPRKPLSGPLFVATIFVVSPPQHFDADRSRDWPHVRPDDDNYRKLVLDAMNKMFWNDDGQVCGGSSFKIYGSPPRTFVQIYPLGPADVEHVRALLGEPASPQPSLFVDSPASLKFAADVRAIEDGK